MKYKLICSDVDGTLVNDGTRITKENQEAIRRLTKEGVMFAICSGRMYNSVSMLGRYYEIPSYAVCSNGAVIANTENDNIFYKQTLSAKKAHELCDLGDEYDCVIGLSTVEGVVYRGSDGIEDVMHRWSNKTYGPGAGRTIDIRETSDYRGYIKEDEIVKLSLWAKNDEDYDQVCKRLSQIEGITAASAMKWNMEITAENVTKWHGVEWLMNRYGIKREEVICLGDSMNDYEMVKNAGLGVAMENADPKLKEAAGYITKSNNDSGVAAVIDLCLEGKL